MQLRRIIASAIAVLLFGSTLASSVRAQVCECQFPQANESGHVAGVFGGGLFAGLVAAVLHIKHSREATLQPRVDPFSTSPVLFDPVVTASAAGALAEPASTDKRGAPAAMEPAGAGAAAPHRQRRGAADRVPRLSANEAQQEGLVPPKTATMMPAYAMIGLGSMLLGLFLVRQRAGRRRRRL
ncbi:MAG TPA: hypothetical protein VIC55_07555 [Gemmatimonadaceae bacterium]|jgi:hypothetical protein